MAGRRPTPTGAKLLRGTFRKDRASGTEPKPQGDPVPPTWLQDAARTVWLKLVPELQRLGLATSVDSETLAAYCQAVSDYGWAVRRLRHDGRVVRDRFGQVRAHPAVGIQAKAAQQLRLLAGEFGLTPSGRVRLGSAAGDVEPDDPEGLLD